MHTHTHLLVDRLARLVKLTVAEPKAEHLVTSSDHSHTYIAYIHAHTHIGELLREA